MPTAEWAAELMTAERRVRARAIFDISAPEVYAAFAQLESSADPDVLSIAATVQGRVLDRRRAGDDMLTIITQDAAIFEMWLWLWQRIAGDGDE